ncbi:hypothetical protein V8F33_003227 [Rhypophila sp. PSN 637]
MGGSKEIAAPKASGNVDSYADLPWIPRNRNWRFIMCFQGKWQDLPVEVLEEMANFNYNTLRPHPVDPAFFFDIVKIRKLVDKAMAQVVRAASKTLSRLDESSTYHGLQPEGSQTGRQIPLSPQMQLKIREAAVEDLAKAYRLDEIACSVAAMKQASSLDEVASQVLRRQPQNLDALYVHFFHEKIPSRRMAQFTDLTPLNTVIDGWPHHPEPWRTRGVVKTHKNDDEGALEDLKRAIALHDGRPRLRHDHGSQQPNTGEQEDFNLKEDDQPSSLGAQLLFHKARAQLTIAVGIVNAALPPAKHVGTSQESSPIEARAEGEPPERTEAEIEAQKLVKKHAKSAIRDFLAFLSHFDYTPDLPFDYGDQLYTKASSLLKKGRKAPRGQWWPPTKHRIYKVHELFNASPVGLPPSRTLEELEEMALSGKHPPTFECLTFHPLLNEALHSLLLCHCLVQTSRKELYRHAHMVVRLTRLNDGFMVGHRVRVFQQPNPSHARRDWSEVIRQAKNWIELETDNWEDLIHMSTMDDPSPPNDATDATQLIEAAASLKLGGEPRMRAGTAKALPSPSLKDAEYERRQILSNAAYEAAKDERVTDDESYKVAFRAHVLRGIEDSSASGRSSSEDAAALVTRTEQGESPELQDQSSLDMRAKYWPIGSDRAQAVIRWILEGPLPPGVQTGPDGAPKKTRKKRKPVDKVSSGATPAARPQGDKASILV